MRNTWLVLAALGIGGCAAQQLGGDGAEGDVGDLFDNEDLTAVDEDAFLDGVDAAFAVSGSVSVGSTLRTTANLNLRSGASTSNRVVLTMPSGSTVTVVSGTPSNGSWYNVRFGSTTGWAHGGYMTKVSSGSTGGSTGSTGGVSGTGRDRIISIARSGVGFSYYWGGGAWDPNGATSSNRGSCSGSCPNCRHSGSYGADCSGYVAKAWQVPSSNTDIRRNTHPYSTANFISTSSSYPWRRINRSNVARGDALVYRSGGAGHIVLYESGSAWGQMWMYEARGCSTGIVRNLRSLSSSYVAIRKNGL
ncbi:MAG: SH3 domain-containing protein [Sandaracinus sp.]|nr:SH3 domain-containing protein [Sandaracinus sp.]